MSTIEWNYRKEPVSLEQIEELEAVLGILLPNTYKAFLQHNHGARPSKKRFDSNQQEGHVLKTFLPITEQNKGNILEVLSWLKGRLSAKLLPIASDQAGNYLCFDFTTSEPEIVLWNHETLETEYVRSTFDELINHLY